MTDVSEQQRANLTKLAAYLRTLPADYRDFDMSQFDGGGYYDARIIDCGTAACAVGHAPGAGIAPEDEENWYEYSFRALTPQGLQWTWCFSGSWDRIDNTPAGAAARIEWMLEHGVPDDAPSQISGTAPLCYLSLLAAPRAGEGVDRG